MDPRLLDYYERELTFIREMGAEFARTYPRIAARLGLDGIDCADPYVERLLEGFAFLTARVQLKLDARHPEFTQHLLEMIYPHFLSPVPSIAIAEFQPDVKEAAVVAGLQIPRGSTLRTPLAKGDKTAVEYRTAHEVTLWPLQITEARYFTGAGALTAQGIPASGKVRAAIRLRFKVSPGAKATKLALGNLSVFIKATAGAAYRIHEQIGADCLGYYLRPNQPGATAHFRGPRSVETLGLDDEHALLPVTRQGFSGYRLLQEYFAFADRFLFFRIKDLEGALAQCEGDDFDVYITLSRVQPALENALDATQFRLFATPVVNLFPKEFDRVHLTETATEQHIVPDRNRPMDFEVHSIDRMTGIGAGGERLVEIMPFYSTGHRHAAADSRGYYTLQRRKRLYSDRQVQSGNRASYVGTECFVSLVDSLQRVQSGEMRQIDMHGYCTNRDLPVQMTLGKGRTDFILEGAAPLESIRCVTAPSYPRPAPGFDDAAWRLISHLSLNYLSLSNSDQQTGADLLREMLSLYASADDAPALRQIEGVRAISFRTVVRRIPNPGPISYGRGLQIDLTLDDQAFEGAGILVLGAVLERFFARYVSINSFTQLRLLSQTRGEVKLWPVRLGNRPII